MFVSDKVELKVILGSSLTHRRNSSHIIFPLIGNILAEKNQGKMKSE